jgi:hypothetical protein
MFYRSKKLRPEVLWQHQSVLHDSLSLDLHPLKAGLNLSLLHGSRGEAARALLMDESAHALSG